MAVLLDTHVWAWWSLGEREGIEYRTRNPESLIKQGDRRKAA